MKASELYAREPEKEFHPFSPDSTEEWARHPSVLLDHFIGCYYNHLAPDINVYELDGINRSTAVVIKVYKDFNFDGRRFWRLASVWFNGKPVMIMQNAGREGDDWAERFITDHLTFIEMLNHIRGLFRYETKNDEIMEDVIDVDEDMGTKLTDFYGNELDGFFEAY